MKIILFSKFFNNLKICKDLFVNFIFLNILLYLNQNINILKIKYLSIFINQNFIFKNSKFIINLIQKFLKGLSFLIELQGKRFKFLLSKYFIFLKMDISHFKFLQFKEIFFLKKYKKKKLFYFFTFENSFLTNSLIKIKHFKNPTKYKKKGLYIKKIN